MRRDRIVVGIVGVGFVVLFVVWWRGFAGWRERNGGMEGKGKGIGDGFGLLKKSR